MSKEVPQFNYDELLIIYIALVNQQTGDPGLRQRINDLLGKVGKFLHDLLHRGG